MKFKIVNFFGLTILIGLASGVIFPGLAISLIPYSIVFLFILMFLSGISIQWSKLNKISNYIKDIIIGNICLFIIFPIIQLLLAKALLTDNQFICGVVFSALTPVAIVAPFFTGIIDGDTELSFMLLITSMIITPFVAPFILHLYFGSTIPISVWPLFWNMIIILPIPLILSFLTVKFSPQKFTDNIKKHLPLLNQICLAILIFILFGVSISKLNINYVNYSELFILFGLVLFQDFGILFLISKIAPKFYPKTKANSFKVSLSMRNIAIAAGILIFYDPRAAIAPAIGFIAHALLFNFIPLFKDQLS